MYMKLLSEKQGNFCTQLKNVAPFRTIRIESNLYEVSCVFFCNKRNLKINKSNVYPNVFSFHGMCWYTSEFVDLNIFPKFQEWVQKCIKIQITYKFIINSKNRMKWITRH